MLPTDFHAHLLPGIDDGAENVEESIKMLLSLRQQGVKRVICTPHFYPYRNSLTEFLQARKQAIEVLTHHPDFPKDMELLYAAEVTLRSVLLNYETLDDLKIPGTDLLLIEMPYGTQFTDTDITLIEKVACNFNIQPVLAHIERYPAVFTKRSLIKCLAEDFLLQVSLDCFGYLPAIKRHTVLKWFAQDLIYCVGTDCHNMGKRPPCFAEPIELLTKKIGENAVSQLISPNTDIHFN